MARYVTLAESIRQNGQRHLENAARYSAAGLPEYAEGSRRKAERNLRRAQDMEIPPFMRPLVDALAGAIAKDLLEGH